MLASRSSSLKSVAAVLCLLAMLLALCACQNEPEPVGSYDAETFASTCYGYVVKTEDRYFFVAADNTREGLILEKGEFAQMNPPLPPEVTEFDGLKTGDYISITVYTVVELYPAQSEVYDLQVIEHCSLADIPSAQVEEIKALGYTIIE